jgi:precorrin-6B methylase 2
VVSPGDTIVEFGAGGGHVGLVLAAAFPSCHVVLLDRKRHSLARAQQLV